MIKLIIVCGYVSSVQGVVLCSCLYCTVGNFGKHLAISTTIAKSRNHNFSKVPTVQYIDVSLSINFLSDLNFFTVYAS